MMNDEFLTTTFGNNTFNFDLIQIEDMQLLIVLNY